MAVSHFKNYPFARKKGRKEIYLLRCLAAGPKSHSQPSPLNPFLYDFHFLSPNPPHPFPTRLGPLASGEVSLLGGVGTSPMTPAAVSGFWMVLGQQLRAVHYEDDVRGSVVPRDIAGRRQ